MLNIRFIHTSLSPLSHTDGLEKPWIWNHEPLGGVEKMEEAAAKSNIRLRGLADFAHARKAAPGESLYDGTVQGLCEWAVVITYHSLKNGIAEKETSVILKEGLDEFLKVVRSKAASPKPAVIEEFVSLFHKEFKNQDIPFQNTAEAPVFDKLVAIMTAVANGSITRPPAPKPKRPASGAMAKAEPKKATPPVKASGPDTGRGQIKLLIDDRGLCPALTP